MWVVSKGVLQPGGEGGSDLCPLHFDRPCQALHDPVLILLRHLREQRQENRSILRPLALDKPTTVADRTPARTRALTAGP